MRKTILDITTSDDKYKYIRTGIDEGFEKHPQVKNILGVAQANFKELSSALNDSRTVVRNPKELQKLASYTLKNAHNAYYALQYPELQAKYEKQAKDMLEIAKAYNELKKHAGGKLKTNGATLPNTFGRIPNGTDPDAKKDAEDFAKFLKGGKITDLIPELDLLKEK